MSAMSEEEEPEKHPFKAGVLFRNVFDTSKDRPTQAAKDKIHGNVKNCVFCTSGLYDGLNHVVPANTSYQETPMYLAPGCSSCNKKYAKTLTLQNDANLVVCRRKAKAKTFYVMK
jgi:hypothetical protein